MAEGSPASLPPFSSWLCLLMRLSLEGLWLLPGKVWMGSHDAHTRASHHGNQKPCYHPPSGVQAGSPGSSSTFLLQPQHSLCRPSPAGSSSPLSLEPGLSSPSSWPQPWSKPLSFFTQTVTKTFSWFRPPWVLQDAGGERRMLTPPPFPPTVLHSAPKADDGLSLITHQRRAIWRSVLLCDLLSVFPVRGS